MIAMTAGWESLLVPSWGRWYSLDAIVAEVGDPPARGTGDHS